jgi:leader peptidase (prepilin peptidase)/N-methyltransferase
VIEYLPEYFVASTFFVLGLVLGSFFNVCIWRIPRKESIVKPPSHCPSCDTLIKWYDNIPVISFFILMGKCRKCGRKISIRYPLVEILTAILFCLCYLQFGLHIFTLFFLIFISFLIIMSFIDIDHYILPDRFTLTLIPLGILTIFFRKDFFLKDSLLGIAAGGGLILLFSAGYYLFRKKIGMGGGDIKLMAGAGAYLGPKLALLTILIGTILALIIAIPYLITKKKGMDEMLPFGPFLALAAIICLFWGDIIFDWWMRHPLFEIGSAI